MQPANLLGEGLSLIHQVQQKPAGASQGLKVFPFFWSEPAALPS